MTSSGLQSSDATNSTTKQSSNISSIDELHDENTHLKEKIQSHERTEREYNEQIQILQLRIKELEDWNGDYQGLLFFSNLLNFCFIFSRK